MNVWIAILVTAIALVSCGEEVAVPKPRMYPRVYFPERTVADFNKSDCPFTFDFPYYGVIKQDSFFFEETVSNPCWFDIDMESLNAKLHCTYSSISEKVDFDKLMVDAFKLAGKHNSMANYRQENLIDNPKENVHGLLFAIEGPVATPMQFYLTDSINHFFRASLYFNAQVNPDSTKIVFDFVKDDITRMIETFKWK